jgi:hypothetical protein
MKHFYKLLLTIATLSPLFSLAQSYYKPGFVINLKGDTLKGFIDLKEWGNNPQDVNFKTSLDKSVPQNFTVNDISYFEVPGVAAYKTFTTSISLDETDIQKIGHERDTSSRTATFFLKAVQQGKNVSLYSYNDNLKDRYYIYDNQAKKVTELTYRVYFVPNDKNNVTVSYQNAYKQQLLLIAQKFSTFSSNLQSLIEDVNYERADLVGIFRKINGNNKAEEKTSNKKYIRFFAGIGLSFNTINLKGQTPLYNASPSHTPLAPKISAGFNFYPVPDVGRSLIKLEVAYSSASYTITGNQYYYDPSVKSTYSFNQHTFSVIPQFQYNIYNTDPFKIYADAGLWVNISQYSGNSIYNPVTAQTTTNFLGLNDRWLSIPLKAGIILKKDWDISLTYSFSESITNNAGGTREDLNYSLNLSTLQVGLNYIF